MDVSWPLVTCWPAYARTLPMAADVVLPARNVHFLAIAELADRYNSAPSAGGSASLCRAQDGLKALRGGRRGSPAERDLDCERAVISASRGII
jgi:hypothetical protein